MFVCLSVCLFGGQVLGQIHHNQTPHGRGRHRACQPLLLLVCLLLAPLQKVQYLVLALCTSCTVLGRCSQVSCSFQYLQLNISCTEGHCKGQPMGFFTQLISLAFLPAPPPCTSTLSSPHPLPLWLSTSLPARCQVCMDRISL